MAIPTIYHDGSSPSEIYYISPIENLQQILNEGVLSHKRANNKKHSDVSDSEVQERRANKIVKNHDRDLAGKRELTIHRYANFYLRAHNSMMFVRRKMRTELCVLRIDPTILNRNEVIISSMNAAKDDAKFHSVADCQFNEESTKFLKMKESFVFNDPDNKKRKAVTQAEVLVPYKLNASYIKGIFVVNEAVKGKIIKEVGDISVPIDVHPSMFFDRQVKTAIGYNPLEEVEASQLNNSRYADVNDNLPTSSDEESVSEIEN